MPIGCRENYLTHTTLLPAFSSTVLLACCRATSAGEDTTMGTELLPGTAGKLLPTGAGARRTALHPFPPTSLTRITCVYVWHCSLSSANGSVGRCVLFLSLRLLGSGIRRQQESKALTDTGMYLFMCVVILFLTAVVVACAKKQDLFGICPPLGGIRVCVVRCGYVLAKGLIMTRRT